MVTQHPKCRSRSRTPVHGGHLAPPAKKPKAIPASEGLTLKSVVIPVQDCIITAKGDVSREPQLACLYCEQKFIRWDKLIPLYELDVRTSRFCSGCGRRRTETSEEHECCAGAAGRKIINHRVTAEHLKVVLWEQHQVRAEEIDAVMDEIDWKPSPPFSNNQEYVAEPVKTSRASLPTASIMTSSATSMLTSIKVTICRPEDGN